MKKLSCLLLASMMLIFGCTKQDLDQPEDLQPETSAAAPEARKCASHEVLEEQMKADPSLRKRMEDLEAFTAKYKANPSAYRLVNGVIEIPVIVHVVYRTSAENISLTQIQSQIDVLNEDFNNTNADRNLAPLEFQDEQTSVGIRFVLDRVIRKYTNKRSWGTNDAVKKSSMGGSDAINTAYYLNFWACNLSNGVLGYAQFPGGDPSTDGIVCLYSAVGRTGTLVANYDRGRTATHEIGHWLNLRHIWGDATCGNDFVGDTPQHNTSNGGCPTYPHKSTCVGTPNEMTMNYMDYTYDRCMYMFTHGQKSRMLAVFGSGGPRAAMAQ
jgi:hypothetical protein